MTAGQQQTSFLQVVAGQHAGQKLYITDALVIGSDNQSEVVIDDPAIQPQHLRVISEEARVVVENLTKSGEVWVNGAQVTRHMLSSGDEIRIGRQRFVVKIPSLRPDSVLRDMPAKQQNNRLWLVWIGVAIAAAAASTYFFLL